MIQGMVDTGSVPVLERLVQFTSARHGHLVNNVANLSTPDFRPTDLSVDAFQQALGKAVDDRRRRTGGPNGQFEPRDTRDIQFGDGGITARARVRQDNILYHDRNNRSVEHSMKELAENAMTHNAAIEMLRSKFSLLESTIREQA